MKKKELKKIAQQIADLEYSLMSHRLSPDDEEQAKQKILDISKNIHQLEEMEIIDEMVQEILNEKIS